MSASTRLPRAPGPDERRTGLLHGLAGYLIWGLLPLFFKLVDSVNPVEVVAHRALWALVFLAMILATRRLYPQLKSALTHPRILGALALSALFITINWLTYVSAVDSNHVVAASLGYFLNPLVSVLMGLVFLGEKLRRGQAIAVLIAAAGVAILAAGEIATLWISLTLAVSFACYGLVRKLTPVGAAVGLTVETLLLAPLALGTLFWFSAHGDPGFGRTATLSALLIASGAITALPLTLFASAARKLPLVILGLMQYITPTMQFLLGVLLFGEHLSPPRWASFALIWAALTLFIVDSVRGERQRRS